MVDPSNYDKVSGGRGHMKTIVIALSVVAVLTQSAFSSEVANTPKTDVFKTWEPYAWQGGFGTDCGDNIEKAIKDEGYKTIRRFYDKTSTLTPKDGRQPDDDVDGCKRDDWSGFASDAGVAAIVSHGLPGEVIVATFEHEGNATAWQEQGSANGGLNLNRTKDGRWLITADEDWFANRFAGSFKSNRAIVFLAACNSGAASGDGNSAGLLEKCGARAAFGYHGKPTVGEAKEDARKIFERMNGSKPDSAKGSKRRAGDAYTDAKSDGLTAKCIMSKSSNPDTTLCPSVEHPLKGAKTYNVFPLGKGAGFHGTGYVTLDTHCVQTPADQILMKDADLEGFVTISDVKWSRDPNGGRGATLDYRIEFSWRSSSAFKVRMIVKRDPLVAEGGGKQNLDGGVIIEDGTGDHGVAPNTDSFTWIFSN
jgi:hypothetical protein